MKTISAGRVQSLLLPGCVLLLIIPAAAGRVQRNPTVIYEVKHAVSLPLSEIVKFVPPPQFHGWIVRQDHDNLNKLTQIYDLPDPVTQDEAEYLSTLPITIGLNFDGMDGQSAGGAIPPDPNGSVGDSQFVMITNFAYQVFDKSSGKSLLGPVRIHDIWTGFGGQCGTEDAGDPVVLWDKLAKRWLVEQLETTSSYQLCVAVSTTDDATGSYNLYAFNWGAKPDYPKLAVWPDAYYLAVDYLGNISGGEPCAMNRAAMLAGKSATMVCFSPSDTNVGYLPSDLDGATLPPKGEPNHFVALGNSNTTLEEYDFHVNFKNPKKSTFTGPNTITVPAYTMPCAAKQWSCIPQPDNAPLLEVLSEHLMFRSAYRNFGDHESLVFSHTVAPGKNSHALTAMRWYELRSTSGSAFSVYQAGTFQSKKNNYWMGSVAMDKVGDIALGFSVVNSTNLDPSIWITGRIPSDPQGKMETPVTLRKGTAVQAVYGYWGDYSSMSVDPTDDCTFWYTQEYSKNGNGGYNWQSHATSFKFNGCR